MFQSAGTSRDRLETPPAEECSLNKGGNPSSLRPAGVALPRPPSIYGNSAPPMSSKVEVLEYATMSPGR